ncbi:MAG: chemotaxis protein CheW [Proteobacteria bacterium]|jgi:purine-binding chemotaxis protein CheW|nr:chemotaxis protein CheW [Pseudomonadota bacterium]NLN63093.1 purine-binding chemotaxis protein CheW [Myxococcales bacterium]
MMRGMFHRSFADGGTASEARKLIVFAVGALACGVDIMQVREVLNPGRITALPGAAPWFLGAAEYRSMLIPVVDMRLRLGQSPEASPKKKWVVVTVSERCIALHVDRVHEVVTVLPTDERNRDPLDDNPSADWIHRVYGHAGALLFEIDIPVISAEADAQARTDAAALPAPPT